jgi:redox-sensitive bicupin YhaK (pirin superfamily)
LRPRKDPGAIYLHKEGYREKLRPSKKRHFSIPFVKSTQAVLGSLEKPVLEALFDNSHYSLDDGLSASLVRLGPNQSFTIQSSTRSGGQYLVNIQGVLKYGDRDFAESSVFFSEPADVSFVVESGDAGAEFLVLQFGQFS